MYACTCTYTQIDTYVWAYACMYMHQCPLNITCSWLFATVHAYVHEHRIVQSVTSGGVCVIADVDGDGLLDVIASDHSAGEVFWCKNEGSFTFGSKQAIQSDMDTPWSVQAVDVDGDGDRDIVHTDTGAHTLSWHENTDGAGTFGAETILANASISPSEFSMADFNGELLCA